MMTRKGQTKLPRIVACLLIIAALCGVCMAATGSWSTTGPFTPGNLHVYAIAVSPDGRTIYCGTGGGAVYSFTLSSKSGSDTYGDSGDSGRDSSYAVTAPGAPAGGTMIFTVNEPLGTVGTGYSYAIISITLVPSGTLGSTDLIVTDAGSTSHVPDGRTVAGIVAISPVAVNPSAISSGTITFAVSGAWLSAHGLTPTNIVLMRFHDGVWAELPTTYQYQSGNAYYFTATTPGFSYFAITSRAAGTTAVNASAAVTTLPESIARTTSVLSSSDSRQATDQKSGVPVAQQTTAAPAGAQTPAGSPGFPLSTIALIGAGCVVLVGGGWYARRWWIQRQNPALFKKYD